MAWINVFEQRTQSGDSYLVDWTITQSSGIPLELFVWGIDPDAYSHVAVVDDIDRFPTTRVEAMATGKSFYRKATAHFEAPNARAFELALGGVQQRLRDVVEAWPGATLVIVPGSDTYVIGEGA